MTDRLAELVGNISVAAVTSWLKTQNVPHSAGSRDAMVGRLKKLLDSGKMSWDQIERGATELEEASSKRILLYSLDEIDRQRLGQGNGISQRAKEINPECSSAMRRAPRNPENPVLAYLELSSNVIRLKFVETHYNLKIDTEQQTISRVPETKLIVGIADLKAGIIQIRFDSPGDEHAYKDRSGRPQARLYREHYLGRIRKLLGCSFGTIDLGPILRCLYETNPRILEIETQKVLTSYGSRMRISSRGGDVRDDPDWHAAHQEGGQSWAHLLGAGTWLASASSGKLDRNVFTEIDVPRATLRFLADCHEAETSYAIGRICQFKDQVS